MARPPAKTAAAETARKPLASTRQGWRTDSNSPANGEKYVTGKHLGGTADVKIVAEKLELSNNANSNGGSISSDTTEKLQRLDAFAAENPGAPVSLLVRELFPQIGIDPIEEDKGDRQIPTKAPALWFSDREPADTPPDFIRRHYAPWLGKGLRRADLRQLDPRLYAALGQHLVTHEMPADIDLPTIKEYNDRWVESVAKGERKPPDKAGAASRLRNAAHVRGERLGKA